ncbi:hypothetical protein MMC10_006192 [Thelotrema lepadinum]|nr:hypothetical protein [Thelotrema lepadinum]
MSTQFLNIVFPPGAIIRQYPKDDPAASAPEIIPAGFADAMTVRKAVFINEQGCSLANEIDSDDEKSYHWVVYGSVGVPKSGSPEPAGGDVKHRSEYERRKSIGGQVPVGTVRLVPPPHGLHPRPGSVDGNGGEPVEVVDKGDRKTKFHDGKELYIKFGRMATVKEFRGMGLGRLLMTSAFEWAKKNKKTLGLVPQDAVEMEKLSRELGGKLDSKEWKGKILVHSQKTAVKFYTGMGFEEDEEIGSWIEEGIEHVAMWKTLEF